MGERIAGELNTREIFRFYQSFGQELMTNDKRQNSNFFMRFCVFLKLFFTETTLFYLFLAHKYELVSKRKEVPAFILCLLLHFIGFLRGDRWMNGACCALHKIQNIVFKQTRTRTLSLSIVMEINMISCSTNDGLCASETMSGKCVSMYSWLVACNWMFHETIDGRSPRKWPKIDCRATCGRLNSKSASNRFICDILWLPRFRNSARSV